MYIVPTQSSFAQETDGEEASEVDSGAPESAEQSELEQGTESVETSEGMSSDVSSNASAEDNTGSSIQSADSDVDEGDGKSDGALADGTAIVANGELQAPTVQDIAAFKQSYKRYRGRINEFREETLSMVEIQRQEAFDLLREQYTEPVSKLKEQQLQQRVTAIERFERFIQKYPKAPEGAGIRFPVGRYLLQDGRRIFHCRSRRYCDEDG